MPFPGNTKAQHLTAKLLFRGNTVAETSASVGISKSRVYALARRHGLPLNQPVHPGGEREQRALAILSAGGDIEAVCCALKITRKIGLKLVTRLRNGASHQ
jgi:hypothetical protein